MTASVLCSPVVLSLAAEPLQFSSNNFLWDCRVALPSGLSRVLNCGEWWEKLLVITLCEQGKLLRSEEDFRF